MPVVIGNFIGNLCTREPLMLMFLMGDCINACVWAGMKTLVQSCKKFSKRA